MGKEFSKYGKGIPQRRGRNSPETGKEFSRDGEGIPQRWVFQQMVPCACLHHASLITKWTCVTISGKEVDGPGIVKRQDSFLLSLHCLLISLIKFFAHWLIDWFQAVVETFQLPPVTSTPTTTPATMTPTLTVHGSSQWLRNTVSNSHSSTLSWKVHHACMTTLR